MTARTWLALALMALPAAAYAQAGKRYALLVGVNEYDSAALSRLKYAENDAAALAGVLRQGGYDEVVELTTSAGKKDAKRAPTAANIRAALERLSGQVKRDDLLLVGLSGHGVLWPVVNDRTKKEREESFFCPSDARPRSEQTFDELKKTMIPLGELFRWLDESGAGVRLLLVDACRNEIKGEARNIDVDHLPRAKRGTAALFSCKGGEKAFESAKYGHGVFFHHVIEALKGGKARTWSQLAEHVTDRVTEDVPEVIGGGAKQTPHEMKNIEGRSPLLLPPQGNAERLFQRGLDAYLGRGEAVIDYPTALKRFEEAASKGHAPAAALAGLMIYFGESTAADKAEGAKRAKSAFPAVRHRAEGDPVAQWIVGRCLAEGVGVGKDEKEAIAWYCRAADKGDATGMFNLGLMYENGRGVGKDEKEGVKWYRRAADQGDAAGMVNLGVMYENGRGVGEDGKEAVAWFRKAADKRLAAGMVNLGVMYAKGRGVGKDGKEAVAWFRKAAEKEDARGMYYLGVAYSDGLGGGKDEKEARKWYQKAADRGNRAAKEALDPLNVQ